MSVSAFALKELAEISRRADNPGLLAGLPDLSIPAETVVVELDETRLNR
jgi:hypothetical protein